MGCGGARGPGGGVCVYWRHLYHALVEAPEPAGLEARTAITNPKVVDGFKGISTDVPKTDLVDAWVIADCVRS